MRRALRLYSDTKSRMPLPGTGLKRILQQNALQMALSGVQGSIADLDDGARRQVLGSLGAGAQYGVLLPFSRQHELEADQTGLKHIFGAQIDKSPSRQLFDG